MISTNVFHTVGTASFADPNFEPITSSLLQQAAQVWSHIQLGNS
jgi:hypothetical protein